MAAAGVDAQPAVSSRHDFPALRIAIIAWELEDGLADSFEDEFRKLGFEVCRFQHTDPMPPHADLIFSFGPYGRIAHIANQLAVAGANRPIFIHWHTESLPSPRIPNWFVQPAGRMRSRLDRINDQEGRWAEVAAENGLYRAANERLSKFRYVGDYAYANRLGVLDCLIDTSVLYYRLHQKIGYRSLRLPWGTFPNTYEDLNLERDIDVLWMGKRRTRRRSRLLDQLREEFKRRGISMHVADNVEDPFLFREERTEYLNRAKITLNLMPTWYDPNFPYRFHLAAPNRTLVVSEPFAPHYPEYRAGEHYVEAGASELAETVQRYLDDDQARAQVVERAYALTTEQLTMAANVRRLLEAVPVR